MGKRIFNVQGSCSAEIHYMVDTSAKIDKILQDYVAAGEYFTINRARQYGKTTTLVLLEKKLQTEYLPIRFSFEGFGSKVWEDESEFIKIFIARCARGMKRNGASEKLIAAWTENSTGLSFPDLEERITALASSAPCPVVLMIDEVDKTSDNRMFLDFLGMLRDMYLERTQSQQPTFHSVILAGVHDIKNLKMKLRPEAKHSYNSPWNIAAQFDVDMSFSAVEIATMLHDYEQERHTGMDIAAVSERIRYYTNGYPFLVSLICKTIDEEALSWTETGVDEAKKRIIKTNNTLFDDVIKNIDRHAGFAELLRQVLVYGMRIAFELRNPDIELGVLYGIISEAQNQVTVSNIIFETVILDYFISIDDAKARIAGHESGMQPYIQNGKLNMDQVLERFSAFMRSEYRDEDGSFIEREGRLLFLSFLKPIINGTGHYVVEPETRGSRRMDVVVFYGGEEHIVELKIWHGEQAACDAYDQLAGYLHHQEQTKGYLLSFCDNRQAPRKGRVFTHNNCEIHEVIVAYRDKE